MKRRRLPLAILMILLLPLEAGAIDISALGSWTEVIDAADLSAGPGSDLNPTYQSSPSATTVGLSNTRNRNWLVRVKRSDITWDDRLTLEVRRTSNGTGAGIISGGTSYTTISLTDQLFFSGSRDRTGINCQYRLSGMTINIPLGSYSTTVIYTVTAP